MIEIEDIKRSEEEVINKKQCLNEINNNKLSLRKFKNNVQLKNKRNYRLFYIKENNNINKDYQFHIINFDASFNTINNYLNSNNSDLISYCLREISIYFQINCPTIKEQKKIIETKFLNTLLNFGINFIEQKNSADLSNILRILINIQFIEEGNTDYLKDICSADYFNFYNNCLNYIDESDNDEYQTLIYRQITWILNIMVFNYNEDNYYLNYFILRNPIFFQILDYYQNKNKIDVDDLKILLELIKFIVDFQNSEEDICKNDKKIIEKCLNLLIKELYGSNTEVILALILESISHISGLSGDYDFNKKLIDDGVSIKILKMKFNNFKLTKNYLKIIKFSMRILANNLTETDENCKLLYDQNIVDYFNNILEKFDDDKAIVKPILYGIDNIAIGSQSEILKLSNIWKEKNIQKYLNYDDEIKILIIRIINDLLEKADMEYLKFLFDTKIFEYLIYVFASFNIGRHCCFKILRLIDKYLSLFKIELKETKEYLIIYNKFRDLFQSSEKIILLTNEDYDIRVIEKRLLSNYE